MKNMKNIIRILVLIVLSLILIYNVTIIFKSILYPNETPDFFGMKTYVVASGSMEPKLKIGDVVVVKETDKVNLIEGDIISFRQGQKVITHRINSILTVNGLTMYQTKGDNNNTYDNELVRYEEIEGKLIFKLSFLGNILLFLQQRNIIIVVIIIFYVLILWEGTKKKKTK